VFKTNGSFEPLIGARTGFPSTDNRIEGCVVTNIGGGDFSIHQLAVGNRRNGRRSDQLHEANLDQAALIRILDRRISSLNPDIALFWAKAATRDRLTRAYERKMLS
jgi:hypothetical protein